MHDVVGSLALFVVLAAVTFALASLRNRLASASAAILPVAAGIAFYLSWLHERRPPDSGDAQPGLVALIGIIVTAAFLVAACVGWGVRAARIRRRRS
jgi:hypothetical protein